MSEADVNEREAYIMEQAEHVRQLSCQELIEFIQSSGNRDYLDTHARKIRRALRFDPRIVACVKDSGQCAIQGCSVSKIITESSFGELMALAETCGLDDIVIEEHRLMVHYVTNKLIGK
jgi:hypothetical protein